MTYNAILFDLDGVLVEGAETEPTLYEQAAKHSLERESIEFPEDALSQLGHPGDLEEVRNACRTLEIEFDEFWQLREQFTSELENEQIQRGERTLYDDVRALESLSEDYGLGIVSSNRQQTVDFIISHFGFETVFDAAYGRDPTPAGFRRMKPKPYYLETAATELGTHDVLYVGDRESDVVAAHNANFDSALLRRDHNRNLDISVAPTHVIEDLYALTQFRCHRNGSN